MKPQQPEPEPRDDPGEAGIQQGGGRSHVTDERLKRVVRQHPQRDEPKVDSVEPPETPPP